jgi:hypothetical protein
MSNPVHNEQMKLAANLFNNLAVVSPLEENAACSERTWARFSPQIMHGIMRAVGAIMRSPNMDRRF